MDGCNSDSIVDKWIQENDKTRMPLPSIELDPHLLISKVRKHYMEYLIRLLTVNYESNQKLLNKNIYLPSAIWRCAKIIETSAAQASMVVQLYRTSITNVIKDLKKATGKGLLYRKLYECLHYAPDNEKNVQATPIRPKDCNCLCSCNQRKKVKRASQSPVDTSANFKLPNKNVLESSQNNILLQTQTELTVTINHSSPDLNIRASLDMPDSDELTQQLDKLFQGDENDDDLFDSALCMADSSKISDNNTSTIEGQKMNSENLIVNKDSQNLDERLDLLSGILVKNTGNATKDLMNNETKKSRPSKWLCEEYFQKVQLFELLDQIRDCDRIKLTRIKERLLELFGADSDDEGVVSPLEENPEFVSSCRERIAPWVVKILTPYYVRGRIRGKNLFKSLAKHLIRLIYQCSKYPHLS